MAEDEKPKSWWQTLPGVITSLTAAVTAVAGLILALKQVGWIGSTQLPPASPQQQQSSQLGGGAGAASAAGSRPVTLPQLREYTLKTSIITLLSATLAQQTSEKDALRIRVRLMNNLTYGAPLFDNMFRLIPDGVPRAPSNNFAIAVAGRAAEETEVKFLLPRATSQAQLELRNGDEQTLVPLTFPAARWVRHQPLSWPTSRAEWPLREPGGRCVGSPLSCRTRRWSAKDLLKSRVEPVFCRRHQCSSGRSRAVLMFGIAWQMPFGGCGSHAVFCR